MIAHLNGKLFSKQPGQAIVDAGGVGYDVVISVTTFTALPAEGKDVSLFIYTQVAEGVLALYGFLDRNEKRLFERLIKVNGVGPKLAVTILSGLSIDRTVAAIRAQDHATLTRIPGVGKKLADMASAPVPVIGGPAAEDVLSALVNLGYQRASAQKAIETVVAKNESAAKNFDELFRASMLVIR
jgi:holliday junction DNA helicase RuvA